MLQKNKKLFSFIISFFMLFQIISPTGGLFASAEDVKEIPGIFKEVNMYSRKGEDEEVPITPGELTEYSDDLSYFFGFTYKIDDGEKVNNGDFAKFKLPENIDYSGFKANMPVELVATEGITESPGEYKIDDDGYLVVTFNDLYKDLNNRAGNIYFQIKVDEDVVSENLEFDVIFDDELKKTFNFYQKPTGGALISKDGFADKELNAEELTWVIYVNTQMDELKNAKVADIIPDGLELDGDIEVYNVKVDLEGNVIEDSEEETDLKPTEFPIELGDINTPYKIVYRTKIVEHNEYFEFTNNAKLTSENGFNDSDDKTIKTPQGKAIVKESKVLNSKQIEWTLKVNLAGQNITEAIIEDQLTLVDNKDYIEKITVNLENIKVYELKQKDDGEFIRDPENPVEKGVFSFSENYLLEGNLGEINSAYEIVYVTDIEYKYNKDSFDKTYTFNNKAELLDGEDVLGEPAESDATTTREKALSKSGKPKIDFDKKEITWTITVNAEKEELYDVWVEDLSGEGLKFKEGSIVVKNSSKVDVTDNFKLLQPGLIWPDESQQDFTLLMGDINEKYTITYTTKIKDNYYDTEDFVNAARISWGKKTDGSGGDFGGGPGEGGPNKGDTPNVSGREWIVIEEKVKAEIKNTYHKSSPGKIDYEEKTIEWKHEFKIYKGVATDLAILDKFETEMRLVEGSINVSFKGVDAEGKSFNEDVKFDLVEHADLQGNDNYTKGFFVEIKSKNTADQDILFKDGTLTLTYKTSFDPNKFTNEYSVSKTYKNKAKLTGTVTYEGDDTELDKEGNASKTVTDFISNEGKKVGDYDRDWRKIEWKVYTNPLSRKYEENAFVVTDALPDGTVLDTDTLRIYKYALTEDGEAGDIAEDKLSSDDYDFVYNEKDNEFTVTFKNKVDAPYVLVFETKLVGLTQKEYKNIAETNHAKNLEDTVTDGKFNNFISKGSDNPEVFVGGKVKWNITINESLSQISDVEVIDELDKGLLYKDDTFKLVDSNGDDVDDDEYDFTVTTDGDNQILELKFKNKINSKYTLTYVTYVTEVNDELSNNAKITGSDNVKQDTSSSVKSKNYSAGGTGSGNLSLGSIEITKTDQDRTTISANETLFRVYFKVGDLEIDIGEFSTTDGILKVNDLPLNRVYYIEEIEAPNGFVKSDDIAEIKVEEKSETKVYEYDFKNEYEKIDVIANKIWVNGPETKPTIILQLQRNGHDHLDPVELEFGTESYTWKNLEKTDISGNDYTYTVVEDEVENYEATYDGLTVTNTYIIPETEFISVEKEFVDGESVRPESVEVSLLRRLVDSEDKYVLVDDIEDATVVLNTDNEWTYAWNNLADTDIDGNEYEYKVIENNVADYFKVTYDRDEENHITITNTYQSPLTKFISVEKEFVDGESVKPESVEVSLLRRLVDSEDKYVLVDDIEDATVVLNTDNDWTYAWDNLADTDIDGNEYEYKVIENDVADYFKVTYNRDEENNITITNTYQSPLTKFISVEKEFVDGESVRPESVEVSLLRRLVGSDDEYVLVDDIEDATVVLNTDNEWAYAWNNLADTDIDGNEYEYSVVENDVADYFNVTYDRDEENHITITNTYQSPLTKFISVEKEFVDGESVRPESVEVSLLRRLVDSDEEYVLVDDIEDATVVLNTDNDWTYAWNNLADTDIHGNEYEYDVVENDVANYFGVTYDRDEENHITITNTYQSPLTKFISVEKVWEDGDKFHTDFVEVALVRRLKDGVDNYKVLELEDSIVRLSAENKWTYSWDELELTDIHGNLYEYTVVELGVLDNFEVDYQLLDDETLIITNKFITPLIDVEMSKVWENIDKKYIPDITIQLFRNDKSHLDSVVLKANTLSHVWKDLELYDEFGEEYEYTVKEVAVGEDFKLDDFEITVDGFEITNEYVGDELGDDLPPTGIGTFTNLYSLIVVAGFIVLLLLKIFMPD